MGMVFNIKTSEIKNTMDAEEFFRKRGAKVKVSQVHRTPNGKVNVTVDGAQAEVLKAWAAFKEIERQEIFSRFKKRSKI